MGVMTIRDHVSGRNVEVEVVSSEQLSDGGTMYTVRYQAKTSSEVDCEFSIIEYTDCIMCQDDWQSSPVTADEIADTRWSDCTPVDGEEMVDVADAVSMLGVSRQRVHQLLQDGKLDGYKVGKTWYIWRWSVEDRMEQTRKPFEQYELDAYLGDFASDFDVDAIVDEATEIDYRTGNRYWKDDIDLVEICERHDISAK